MSPSLPRLRATYDAYGNVVLSCESAVGQECASATPLPLFPLLSTATGGFYADVTAQYRLTLADTRRLLQNLSAGISAGLRPMWFFLCQPIWIPGRRGVPRQRRRGVLFLCDTVRFGATFGAIFAVLFLGMNYESFGQIAGDLLDPLAALRGRAAGEEMHDVLSAISPRAPAGERDITQFLPPVGPPENRLIVPALHLNVPIVIPPSDALLAEDWQRLEQDIQTALESGVVHYPGTARPGQGGNFFVTGHSSYYPWATGKYKAVFARLSLLKPGDEYWVYYGGDKHRYVVREKKEVKPTDVDVLDQPLDERTGTLMTCTPVGTTLRRLVVVAREVDPLTGVPLAVGQHAAVESKPRTRLDVLPI